MNNIIVSYEVAIGLQKTIVNQSWKLFPLFNFGNFDGVGTNIDAKKRREKFLSDRIKWVQHFPNYSELKRE